MTQEKGKTHLSVVPNAAENAYESRDFHAVPQTAGEPEICPKCYGSGMEVVPGKGARQCECRKLKKHHDHLEKARIPKRYLDCHFHNYKILNPSLGRAHGFAFNLANNYPANERGALFMGDVGIGKTHLAVSIIKGLTEKGFDCLFYEFGALLKEIQGSYNSNTKTSELGVLSPIFDAEILVLDEIGASKPTEWVRDTMAHIINTRYNDKKLTIFTTNYLDERRNEREEVLEDRIGIRLRSRLYEMCKTIVMVGDDFRRTLDQDKPFGKR